VVPVIGPLVRATGDALYDIPVDRVRGHKEMPGEHTLCPGRHFNLNELRRALAKC